MAVKKDLLLVPCSVVRLVVQLVEKKVKLMVMPSDRPKVELLELYSAVLSVAWLAELWADRSVGQSATSTAEKKVRQTVDRMVCYLVVWKASKKVPHSVGATAVC